MGAECMQLVFKRMLIEKNDLRCVCPRISEGNQANATFLAKACGVLAGVEVASRVFELVDSQISVEWLTNDGQWVEPGMKLGQVLIIT